MLYTALRLSPDDIARLTGWGLAEVQKSREAWRFTRTELDGRPLAGAALLRAYAERLGRSARIPAHRATQLDFIRRVVRAGLDDHVVSLSELAAVGTLDAAAQNAGIRAADEQAEAHRRRASNRTNRAKGMDLPPSVRSQYAREYAAPVVKLPLSEMRLWLLFVLAQFSEYDLAVLTNWSCASVAKAITRFGFDRARNHVMWEYTWAWAVRRLLMERIGYRMSDNDADAYAESGEDFQRWLLRRIGEGTLDWKAVEKLRPWVPASLEYRYAAGPTAEWPTGPEKPKHGER